MWQVGVAVERAAGTEVRLAFHAPKRMVTTVMDCLNKVLFEGYELTGEFMPQILNGKCHLAWVADVRGADLHRLSLKEWLPMIKSMMERRFRCRVTCFEHFDKFLNA